MCDEKAIFVASLDHRVFRVWMIWDWCAQKTDVVGTVWQTSIVSRFGAAESTNSRWDFLMKVTGCSSPSWPLSVADEVIVTDQLNNLPASSVTLPPPPSLKRRHLAHFSKHGARSFLKPFLPLSSMFPLHITSKCHVELARCHLKRMK